MKLTPGKKVAHKKKHHVKKHNRCIAVADDDRWVGSTLRAGVVEIHLPLEVAFGIGARRKDYCLISHNSPSSVVCSHLQAIPH